MGDERLAGRLLTVAGLGTWAVVGVLPLLEIARSPALLLRFDHAVYTAAYLAFGILLLLGSASFGRGPRRADVAALAVQSALAAVAVLALPGFGFTGILFIITAALAAEVLELRAGVAWIGGQSVVVALALLPTYPDPTVATIQTIAYLGFQLFALLTALSTRREAESRAALARQAAELRATRELLAESSRVNERVRIARELHDLLGHHLTALAVNLEVAGHLSDGKVKEHVQRSHGLAKLLLADVREAVSTMRDGATVDLSGALHALVQDIPRPRVHLDAPPDLRVDDLERAHAVLRCVQEVVTNAVRHAEAANLWITVRDGEGGIAVEARDDGRGSDGLRFGTGLSGMRERLEALGGDLRVETAPSRGFALHARVPGGAP